MCHCCCIRQVCVSLCTCVCVYLTYSRTSPRLSLLWAATSLKQSEHFFCWTFPLGRKKLVVTERSYCNIFSFLLSSIHSCWVNLSNVVKNDFDFEKYLPLTDLLFSGNAKASTLFPAYNDFGYNELTI